MRYTEVLPYWEYFLLTRHLRARTYIKQFTPCVPVCLHIHFCLHWIISPPFPQKETKGMQPRSFNCTRGSHLPSVLSGPSLLNTWNSATASGLRLIPLPACIRIIFWNQPWYEAHPIGGTCNVFLVEFHVKICPRCSIAGQFKQCLVHIAVVCCILLHIYTLLTYTISKHKMFCISWNLVVVFVVVVDVIRFSL